MQTIAFLQMIIVIVLVVVILLQRPEGGGAFGIGGGSEKFLSGRGQASLLVRSTVFLGVLFFSLAVLLALIAKQSVEPASILERVSQEARSNPGLEREVQGNDGEREVLVPPPDRSPSPREQVD